MNEFEESLDILSSDDRRGRKTRNRFGGFSQKLEFHSVAEVRQGSASRGTTQSYAHGEMMPLNTVGGIQSFEEGETVGEVFQGSDGKKYKDVHDHKGTRSGPGGIPTKIVLA